MIKEILFVIYTKIRGEMKMGSIGYTIVVLVLCIYVLSVLNRMLY